MGRIHELTGLDLPVSSSDIREKLAGSILPPDLPAPAPSSPVAAAPQAVPRAFAEEVRQVLERALAACGGRVYGPQGSASLLGLKPTTLQGKLKKYRVAASPAPPPPRGA